jgi:hypothetical protein
MHWDGNAVSREKDRNRSEQVESFALSVKNGS